MLYVKNRVLLDNSDNLKSVHCLYLLFVYMFIVCFSYVLCSEGHMVEWLSCQMYHPLEI